MQKHIQIGKYRISPITRQLTDGSYSSSVSIKAGRGSTSMDRIVRFIHLFKDEHTAKDYALQEGLNWVNDPQKYQRGW